MARTAILYSGSAYNIKYSLQSQLENLIIPNDADVFVLTTRYCLRRKTKSTIPIPDVDFDTEEWNKKNANTIRDNEPLSNEELELIKSTFGNRLKVVMVAEDTLEYMSYIEGERNKVQSEINNYNKESANLENPICEISSIGSVVDQYRHAWKLYQLMQDYEKQTGIRYEWIMRARMDFIVPFEFNLKHYYENHDEPYLYDLHGFAPNTPYWFEEYCWFSKRKIADMLFPALNKIGLLTDRKYSTIEGEKDHRFSAEVQCGLLIYELGLQDKIIPVRIWRSCCYSSGGDGYDYFNYMFRRPKIDIEFEYSLVCKCKTDINEHLPVLRKYAEQCNHVTEIGVRYGNSTIAFMAARPKRFISYDVTPEVKQEYLKIIAEDAKINWELKIMNPTPEDGESLIEETDLLFIDTNHHSKQLSLELKLHASKVRKYIILHDMSVFWDRGAGDDHINDGMKLAVEPFLKKGNWRIKERLLNNNGLMIMERVN